MLQDIVVAQTVQLTGRNAGDHMGRDEIEYLGGEAARHPHAFVVGRVVDGHGVVGSALAALCIGHEVGLISLLQLVVT